MADGRVCRCTSPDGKEYRLLGLVGGSFSCSSYGGIEPWTAIAAGDRDGSAGMPAKWL